MSRIEDEVCRKIQERAEVGLNKYGTTMEREDFSKLDWLIYFQEELMDGTVYAERMIKAQRVARRSSRPLTRRGGRLEHRRISYLE